MYDMDVNEIKQLIKKSKMENGMTKDEATLNYYDELSLLLEDIEYFTLYLKRHKTSKFNFDIKVNYGSSSKSFMDIWKLYEYRKDRESIDATFAKFSLLQAIIEEEIYDLCKDRNGETVQATFIVKTYDNGTVIYNLTDVE